MAFSNALVLGFLLAISMVMPTFATVYTVGDTSGWGIGGDYSTWASDKTFNVGDSLAFNYGSGHTVDEVKEDDFKSCTTGNSISTASSGPTTIPLKTAGTHYFICSVAGHCSGGMKLAVTVKAGKSSTTSPSGSATPSSDGTTTTATPTTTTTPTTTKSDSSSGSRATTPILLVLIVSCFFSFVMRL